MASKDMSVVMYDGAIRLNYIDKSHYYSVQERENWELPEDDTKAWGKKKRPRGTTTLLDMTLEKKGLMTWPMGMALDELFGFYNFYVEKTDEDGNVVYDKKTNEPVLVKRIGFRKELGTMWIGPSDEGRKTVSLDEEQLLPIVKSASENYLRKQKKGADIGSVVHEAIEHFVRMNPGELAPVVDEESEDGSPKLDADGNAIMELPPIIPSGFDIGEQYMWNIKENEQNYQTPAEYDKALEEFPNDLAMAETAFSQFVSWWTNTRPKLLGAEDLIYSRAHHISGTFDGLIKINGKVVLADWKTSNASKSKLAAMPEGIGYSYFIQSAIYAMAWAEMGNGLVDDLLIVSCRKDGGFTTIYASDLGLSVQDCMNWAKAVIACYKFADQTRNNLIAHAEGK